MSLLEDFLIKPSSEVNLSEFQTDYSGEFSSKKEAQKLLTKNIKKKTYCYQFY